MKIRWFFTIVFVFTPCLVFAEDIEVSGPKWFEIAKTMLALLASIVGIALTITKLKVSGPSSEKVELEIEKLKLEVEEKKWNLQQSMGEDYKALELEVPKINKSFENPPTYSRAAVKMFPRIAIGVLSISLPIIIVVGSMLLGEQTKILASMGAYYHTNMRDFYVGVHLVISVILFSYWGYGRMDYIVTKIQGIFCMLIGFCPIDSNIVLGSIHTISTVLFLLLQSYISLFLFTRTFRNPSKQKVLRNRVFRICGMVIIVCFAIIIGYTLILKNSSTYLEELAPIFNLEAIAYWAFGISWLLKGQFMFKD